MFVVRALKWVLVVVVAVVILTAAAVAAIPYLVDLPRIQTLVATNASNALGRPVRFASLSVSLLPLPGVTLHKLEVADDAQFGSAPFLTLDSGRLSLKLRPLLTGRVEFTELVLAKPVITVIRDGSGRLNVATLGVSAEPRVATPRPPRTPGGVGAGAALALPATMRIEDAVLVYIAHGAGGASTRYRAEKVDLTIKGSLPQVAFKGSARLMPGDVTVRIADGVATLTPGHGLIDAPVRANVTIDAPDLGALAAATTGTALGIGGSMKGTLAVAGTAAAPTASGDVTVSKLALSRDNPQCPDPKRRTFQVPSLALASSWRDGRLVAQPMRADLGKGALTATLDVDVTRGMRARLDDLAVKALPLESLTVDFLCQGYALTGPLDLSGALAFAASQPLETMSGPGSLKIGAGKIVGKQAIALLGNVVRVGGAVSSLLNADVPASTFAAPLEFESITGTYRITDGIAATRDLRYTSRAMKVGIAGDYALASGAMNLDVTVNHGRGEIQAKVTGTAAAPSVRVVPSSLVRGLDQKKVETGLRDLLKRFR
jgi:hypothetical protein